MRSKTTESALRVAGIYLAVSALWIAFSDRLAVALAEDYASLAWFQTGKGLFFVVSTSVLLYFFSLRQFTVLTELQAESERDARKALATKEALLHEIQHRVKNNLQVILSLMSLRGGEAARSSDVRDKIRSMGVVHDLVTESPDMSSVDASEFAKRLATAFADSGIEAGATIAGEGDRVDLNADDALAVGLFIAEACSNSGQFGARPGGGTTSISISIKAEDGVVRARVRDDGPGFPNGKLPENGAGYGCAMMKALALQVGGELSSWNDGGAVAELTLPVRTTSRPKPLLHP